MTATRQTHLSLTYYFGAVLGSAAAALIALPFGVVATAVSQTVRSHLTLPFALNLLRRGIGISPRAVLRNVAPPYLAGLAMFIILLPIPYLLPNISPIFKIALLSALGALIYAVLMLTVCRRFTAMHYRDFVARLPERLRVKAPKWGF